MRKWWKNGMKKIQWVWRLGILTPFPVIGQPLAEFPPNPTAASWRLCALIQTVEALTLREISNAAATFSDQTLHEAPKWPLLASTTASLTVRNGSTAMNGPEYCIRQNEAPNWKMINEQIDRTKFIAYPKKQENFKKKYVKKVPKNTTKWSE